MIYSIISIIFKFIKFHFQSFLLFLILIGGSTEIPDRFHTRSVRFRLRAVLFFRRVRRVREEPF